VRIIFKLVFENCGDFIGYNLLSIKSSFRFCYKVKTLVPKGGGGMLVSAFIGEFVE
jgi:hypothetical protein